MVHHIVLGEHATRLIRKYADLNGITIDEFLEQHVERAVSDLAEREQLGLLEKA